MSQRMEIEVVLRNTLLQPEAVRIGRQPRPPVAGAAAAPAAPVVPVPAVDHDALV